MNTIGGTGTGSAVWEVVRKDGTDRMVVRFRRRISAADGADAADRFLALLGGDRVDVTFDLREVSGYDSGARSAWQEKVWPVRQQVRSLHFVGTSAVTRMGATLFGLALGVPVSFSES